MRAVVIGDDRMSKGALVMNAEFLRFATHWSFRPRACRPYRAKTKGKVERPIRYLRESFFYGRTFLNDADLNAQAEQAITYFRDYTALPEHEIQTEVDRYIAWPAQASSYYLGESAILEARAKAEKALGSRFNVRAFHDTVLELGSVPLLVLAARVDQFIAAAGQGPYPALE
jgi:hypothetical protein